MNDQKADSNKSSFNINSNNANKYDAIVIGSGMTGGWSAKEFTEAGFKTLMLERGRNVEHIRDYTTANMEPHGRILRVWWWILRSWKEDPYLPI